MSDPYMTQFWREADPPWDKLGPEIAATFHRIPVQPPGRMSRWAQQLKQARLERGLSGEAADRAAGLWEGATREIERGSVGSAAHSAWAKLSAFYGVTLV